MMHIVSSYVPFIELSLEFLPLEHTIEHDSTTNSIRSVDTCYPLIVWPSV